MKTTLKIGSELKIMSPMIDDSPDGGERTTPVGSIAMVTSIDDRVSECIFGFVVPENGASGFATAEEIHNPHQFVILPMANDPLSVAVRALRLAQLSADADEDQARYAEAANALVTLRTRVLAHDSGLNIAEQAPTGDDYNDLLAMLALHKPA